MRALARNVARERPDLVNRPFDQAVEDAGGAFPHRLIEPARNQADAPGGSAVGAGEGVLGCRRSASCQQRATRHHGR